MWGLDLGFYVLCVIMVEGLWGNWTGGKEWFLVLGSFGRDVSRIQNRGSSQIASLILPNQIHQFCIVLSS